MKLYKQFLLVPVVLVIFSCLFYSTYKDDKDRVLNEFNTQQFAQAKQAVRSIEKFFIYYREELQFLSKLNNISPLNDHGKSLLADFYNNHSDQIEAITVLDSKGILKYTFPLNESAIGTDVSYQEHVGVIINTHKPTISATLTSFRNRLYIFISFIIIVTAVFFYIVFKASSRIKERKLVNHELVAAKERAEESDRLKSAFLTNMSHELRTPLNAIIGYSGLMIDSGLNPDINSNLKVISNSAYQLLDLVEDILDISMIETEQIKIIKKEVSISSILNELNETFSEEILKINKNELKLVLKTSPDINEIVIFTDSKKLKQVFIILFKNALKFTAEGYIEFGVMKFEKDDLRYLKFFVKDTGIGIERDQYDVIFNIFRQIDDTHSRKYGGTGIGLTIAKKLIGILGGEIFVESEPGKGSEFYFTIPLITEKVQ